jgi:hypothetical protein
MFTPLSRLRSRETDFSSIVPVATNRAQNRYQHRSAGLLSTVPAGSPSLKIQFLCDPITLDPFA